MNPLILGGSELLIPALVAAAKSIPAAQLARFGLLRGPFVGLGPVLGAFVGGGVAVALLVPGSRAWLKAHAIETVRFLKERGATFLEDEVDLTADVDWTDKPRRKRNGKPAADIGA